MKRCLGVEKRVERYRKLMNYCTKTQKLKFDPDVRQLCSTVDGGAKEMRS